MTTKSVFLSFGALFCLTRHNSATTYPTCNINPESLSCKPKPLSVLLLSSPCIRSKCLRVNLMVIFIMVFQFTLYPFPIMPRRRTAALEPFVKVLNLKKQKKKTIPICSHICCQDVETLNCSQITQACHLQSCLSCLGVSRLGFGFAPVVLCSYSISCRL